jgi:hypothetical protein
VIFFNWALRLGGVLGSGGIAPRILDLGTRLEVSGQLHAPDALLQGKSRWHPLDRRLRGPQSRSGQGGEEKHPQPLPYLEPPIIQPIAQRYTTELSRLLIIIIHLCI